MKNYSKLTLTILTSLFVIQSAFAGATEDLWKALKEANYPNALVAISAGADVKNLDAAFGTPLNLAACWADANVVKALIDAGSDIHYVAAANGYTPLMNAVFWGNVEAVKLLLAAKSDIKIKDKLGQTMLATAVAGCKLETMELLVAAGADPKEKFEMAGIKDQTALSSVMGAKEPAEKVAYIKSVGTSLAGMGITFPPRLANAKESDFTPSGDMAVFLLKNGADPNQTIVGFGGNILNQSIEFGKIGVTKALIDNGASYDAKAEINVFDKKNVNGVFPNVTYENGDYVLVAVISGSVDFVKFMVEKDPKQVFKMYKGKGFVKCENDKTTSYFSVEGVSLLMIAAEHGNPEIVRYLFNQGFDKDDYAEATWSAANKKQHCPMLNVRRTMGFAKNSGNQEVIDIIKSSGKFKDE